MPRLPIKVHLLNHAETLKGASLLVFTSPLPFKDLLHLLENRQRRKWPASAKGLVCKWLALFSIKKIKF